MRFNTKHLFVVVALVAVGLSTWLSFRPHPAHENWYYEQAKFSRSGRFSVDRHDVRIRMVSRNDRDGSALVENGFGRSVNEEPKYHSQLQQSGPWLDCAQLEFSHDGPPYAVRRVKVFDTDSRQLISDAYSGCRLADSGTVQLFRLGAKLPDRVDVWMELRSFPEAESFLRIPAVVGGKGQFFRGTLVIKQIQHIDETGYVGFDFGLKGYAESTDLVAVTKTGERIHSPVHFDQNGTRVWFQLKSGETIDCFELRHERKFKTTFFFDGVKLPRSSGAKFAAPPQPTISMKGAVATKRIAEFLPLDVSITAFRGNSIASYLIYNGEFHVPCFHTEWGEDLQTTSTIRCEIKGLSDPSVVFELNPESQDAVSIPRSDPNSVPSHAIPTVELDLPIEAIESFKMRLK